MIIVADDHEAQAARAEGRLVCSACGGRFGKHGFARARSVRTRGGGRRELRPARVRCTNPACGRTHVLLAAWCVPGRADDAETIGAALQAAVAGQGHRPIADRLGVPAGTVRGWLRAARAGADWLYQTAVSARDRVNVIRDDPALPLSEHTPLAHAIDALGAAAAAIRRFLGAALGISGWPLIVLITGGRLLRPPLVSSG